MLELRGAAGLAQEPLYFFRRRQAAGPLHLERDDTLEPRVPGLEHVAERADAQFRPQFESIEAYDSLQQPAGQILARIGRNPPFQTPRTLEDRSDGLGPRLNGLLGDTRFGPQADELVDE